jgi:hypothetical protein
MGVTHAAGPLDRVAYYGVRFLAQTAQGLFLAVLVLLVGHAGTGPLGFSTILVAAMAAAVLLGLPGGMLVDWLGAPRALALGATLRLVAVLCALTLLESAMLAWAVMFLYSAASQLFSPSEMALVPVIEEHRPARGHAWLTVLQYAGQGTAILFIGLSLYLDGGPAPLLTAAIVLYALVAGIAVTLALRLRLRRAAGPPTRRRHARSLRPTLCFFATEPRARSAVGLLAFVEIATKGLTIAAPFYLAGELGFGHNEIVTVAALVAVGTGAGLFWAARWLTVAAAPRLMQVTLAGAVVAIFALAAAGSPWGAAERLGSDLAFVSLSTPIDGRLLAVLPIALILGLAAGIAPISARALLTHVAGAGHQGRIFASQATVTDAIIAMPLLLTGAGIEHAGPEVALASLASAGLALLLLVRVWERRPAGESLATAHAELLG